MAAIFEQIVKDALGHGAVGADALKRKIFPFCGLGASARVLGVVAFGSFGGPAAVHRNIGAGDL